MKKYSKDIHIYYIKNLLKKNIVYYFLTKY